MTQIPDGSNELDRNIVHAKRQMEKMMIEFHKYLEDKMLPENKTQGQFNQETDFLLRLFKAANELDMVNAPEGTFGLITLMVRIGFVMRDKHNKIEYENKLLLQEINKLKKQITDMSSAGQRNG